MSNSRDLLKEAIADAKSVKEAAIANAKAALEEAFTPYLQEKFAAKLAEMELEEEEDVTEEMTDENYGEDGSMEEEMSNPIQRRGDDEKKNGKFSRESEPEIETEEDRYKGIKGDEDELDLEELLAELDEEVETEGMEKKDDLMEAEDQEEEYVGDDERYEYEKGKEAGEDEEIDLEDMSEEDLKSLIEDVIADMVAAGELEAGENFEEEGDEEEIDIDMKDEEEEEITERKKEGYNAREDESVSARRGKEADKKQSFKARRDDSYGKFGKRDAEAAGKASGPGTNKINKENLNEEEVEEMKNQIAELASTLSEVKLLNAKLLYTNKIFRAKNLNESQKVKVLEAFDKATSVKEAKLIYETLTTIKETKSPVTESMRGMASKAVGIAPEKKPILEVNNQFARWQVLAGIKNN